MSDYKYLIIGGGMTAESAVGSIRKMDPDGSIALISAESVPPYNRPPLSKELWKGKTNLDSIWRKTECRGVELHLGRKVKSIDPKNKSTVDDQGEVQIVAIQGAEQLSARAILDAVVRFRPSDMILVEGGPQLMGKAESFPICCSR